MKMIAGLGNPGREYEETRHNAGFQVIDLLAAQMNIAVDEKKHKGLVGRGILEGQKVVLLKPQTYMNLSGESVRAALDFYKLPVEDLVVVFDDISLEPGYIRIRKRGSAGGHNGIKSLISCLGSEEFARVKVGVGAKPQGRDLAAHVLGRVREDDRERMEAAFGDAAAAVRMMVRGEIEAGMNRYNHKKKEDDGRA